MGVENNDDFKLENLFNVKGKIAVVSGGGSGIGLMATQALAVNGAKGLFPTTSLSPRCIL